MTKHIIICFGDRRRIIALPSSYNGLLKVAREQFPNMSSVHSLVALYQPEDFKDIVDDTCWVEIDKTAYGTLHDRAVVHFNVQHPITKEYILPLPGTDPDQPQPRASRIEESPLAGPADSSRYIDPDDSSIQQATTFPNNNRDDADACANGWGGASERFRRSAKYIPNPQDCKDAIDGASDQWNDPKSTKLEEEEKVPDQVNSGVDRRWEALFRENPQTQDAPVSENNGWGHAHNEHHVKNENTQHDNPHPIAPIKEEEDLGALFDQSTPVRGSAPAPNSGIKWEDIKWEGPWPAVRFGPSPGLNASGAQYVPDASIQHPQDHGLPWCPQTAQFHSHRAFSPARRMGRNSQMPYASGWNLERPSQKQPGPCWQQQGKGNQPQPHAAEYRTGSPIKSGRYGQQSDRYWNGRNSQSNEENTAHQPVSPLYDETEQPRADRVGKATVTGPDRPETDGNASIPNCGFDFCIRPSHTYKGPRIYVSSSSDDYPEHSAGKPSKGWGKATTVDNAVQCSLAGGGSAMHRHGNKANTGKRQCMK